MALAVAQAQRFTVAKILRVLKLVRYRSNTHHRFTVAKILRVLKPIVSSLIADSVLQ